jgi:hypothetical protein
MSERYTEKKINHPSWYQQFGIWCSGVCPEIIKRCPTTWNNYAIQGYVILMTALLSFVSGSYFLSFVFPEQDWKVPVIFGIVWAYLIFTLDRSIIVSMKKTGFFWQELKVAIPRFILAIFIGIVIATPIELRLFEGEILAKLEEHSKIRQEQIIKQDNKNLDNRLKPKRERLKELEKIKSDYEKANESRIEEAEGTSGTKKIGKGPVYKEKEERYLETKKNWDTVQAEYSELQKEIGHLTNQTAKETKIDGVGARVEALYQLSDLHWFITLLFILIECLPVITKLMNKRSPYDEILETMEYEMMIEQKEIISRRNSEINELLKQIENASILRLDVVNRIAKDKAEAELKNNKAILGDIAKKQLELAKIAINKWYQEERGKI